MRHSRPTHEVALGVPLASMPAGPAAGGELQRRGRLACCARYRRHPGARRTSPRRAPPRDERAPSCEGDDRRCGGRPQNTGHGRGAAKAGGGGGGGADRVGGTDAEGRRLVCLARQPTGLEDFVYVAGESGFGYSTPRVCRLLPRYLSPRLAPKGLALLLCCPL